MPLQIIRNDITKVKADAIVNTANPKPVIGAGTDSAVYAAAGQEKLLAARKRIGDIKPGDAVETSAYDLDAKFIIHTVCIPWEGNGTDTLDVLSDCYRNSLKLAEELNCKSVAFPLIGTGAYGIPHDDAIGVARDVIDAFLQEHESSMKVVLVLFDQESLAAGEALNKKIKAYIDETYVAGAVVNEYGLTAEDVDSLSVIRRRRELYSREISGIFRPMNVPRGEKDPARDAEKSFSRKVFEYVDDRGLKDSELYGGKYERFFPRQTLSRIRNDDEYHPKKYICVTICLVLKLDLDETQDLLMRAGYSLSVSRKADIVVRYCIENRIFDYYKVDKLLEDNGFGGIKKLV